MPLLRHTVALLLLLLAALPGAAEPVRVATWNIRFLSSETLNCQGLRMTDVREQGARLANLRAVVDALAPHAVAVQEVRDRAALALVFPPPEWTVVFDDDTGDCLNLALAVRAPFEVPGATGGRLDATPDHFLCDDAPDHYFPGERDVLAVPLRHPDLDGPLWVLCVHAKSRSGGRATTAPRREGAARILVERLSALGPGVPVLLLGDFNDTPDDASLNILETGDPGAKAAMERERGALLVNLTEPLWAEDRVSYGRGPEDMRGGRVETRAPGQRRRNFEARARDEHTGDALLDNMLATPGLAACVVPGSVRLYDGPEAVRGERDERASDHLPVYADLVLDRSASAPAIPALDLARRGALRVATFNVSLFRRYAGELARDLADGTDPQARAVAAIIQRVRPDVLLLNEFDHDPGGEALRLFRERYLAVAQEGAAPIEYPHVFTAPVNTGVDSGFDLDGNGRTGGPGDAWGYGYFPGQYGMALLSRHPILEARCRTFRRLPWAAMPGHRMPPGYFPPEAAATIPLSSKSHWDVAIDVSGSPLHLLCSHPTPPVFDGDEGRNGRRNHDEIRLWADYLHPEAAGYIVDDAGRAGGLAPGEPFVLLGDQNADADEGESVDAAIRQLLDHAAVNAAFIPDSPGGREQGDADDTAVWAMRAHYVLPSRAGLLVRGGGVYWPAPGQPGRALVDPDRSSDHRLVWVDLDRP